MIAVMGATGHTGRRIFFTGVILGFLSFTRENALASDGGWTLGIRVPGRLERIDVQCERIQELVRVTITRQSFRDREFALPSDSARAKRGLQFPHSC